MEEPQRQQHKQAEMLSASGPTGGPAMILFLSQNTTESHGKAPVQPVTSHIDGVGIASALEKQIEARDAWSCSFTQGPA